MAVEWRKSSHSNASGGTCVELTHVGAIRDSRTPLPVSRAALESFVNSAKRRTSE
ncbi:DUF397 domain-containing protein [Umezawaea sp. NPDC059074]|uniref:DUF397 domain-containing protein n=1 Tax=Umezawaea sp. NPDC059074 TaxID=3346716 RepID=UPI0036A9DC7F